MRSSLTKQQVLEIGKDFDDENNIEHTAEGTRTNSRTQPERGIHRFNPPNLGLGRAFMVFDKFATEGNRQLTAGR
jgi:hypothetical protein